MLPTKSKLSKELLSLVPQPLHLIIEGQTRSGKTRLAQQLAKELGVYAEVWSSLDFPFPQTVEYSIIPDAPIYKSDFLNDGLPTVWQERAEYWQKNINSRKCIIIDECPKFSSNSFLTRFLNSHSSQNTNIILNMQCLDTSMKTESYLLGTQKYSTLDCIKSSILNHRKQLVFNRLLRQFFIIRLGFKAENYAYYTLKNRSLVYQIRCAKHPCLIENKVINLANFEL